MGHGIVCHLNHELADSCDDTTLATTLIDVVGTDTYPSGGIDARTVRPWTVAGAWHSNRDVLLTVTATTITVTEHPGTDTGTFSPCHSGGSEARRTQELMRHPHELAQARARHTDIADMLWGTDPVGDTGASIWWVYADGIGALHQLDDDELAALGAQLRTQSTSRRDAGITVGSHAALISCAGRVSAHGTVTMRWHANALTHAESSVAVTH